jgi:cell division protein FtsZ
MGIAEVSEAAEKIKSEAHPDANIIFGAVIDDELEDRMMITVIATGLGGEAKPVSLVSVQGGAGSQQMQGLNQPVKAPFSEGDNTPPVKPVSDTVVNIKETPSYIERFSDAEEEVNYEDDQWDIPTFMRKQAD